MPTREDDDDFNFDLPPRVDFEPTSIVELIALAAHLQADSQINRVFRRTGWRGDTTLEEDDAIDGAIQYFCRSNLEGIRDPILLLLSQVLCRAYAGGRVDPTDIAAAEDFLTDRYFGRANSRNGILAKEPSVEEVRWIAADLRDVPEIWQEISRAGLTAFDPAIVENLIRPTETRLRWRKYGLANRTMIATYVLRYLAIGEIDDLGSPEAERLIRFSNDINS